MSDDQSADLGSILTLPTPTPGAIAADPAPDTQAPAVPQAPPAVPQAPQAPGLVFDPAVHERDPATGGGRLNKAGTAYLRKRGNGARAAKGLPLAGSQIATRGQEGTHEAPEAPTGQNPAQDKAPAAPQQASRLVLPGDPGDTWPNRAGASNTGADGMTVQVLPPDDRPEPRSLDEYESTAQAVTHGIWAIAQMAWGPKWEPEREELKAWAAAVKRVFHHYQLPIVGPIAELVVIAFRSAAKRADSTKVRAFFARAWDWAMGRREVHEDPRSQGHHDPARMHG